MAINNDGATLGRVYGGAPALLHYADGTRADAGRDLADFLDWHLRIRNGLDQDRSLCPGCYMVALFNAATSLAERNGQSLAELGRTLGHAFLALSEAKDPAAFAHPEHVQVLLDPEEDDHPVSVDWQAANTSALDWE